MKTLVALALVAGAVVSLAGCSASPLTAKDAVATAKLSAPTNLVVGDSITVSASGKLLHGRTDATRLAIQKKSGSTWSTVKSETHKVGGKLYTASLTVKVESAVTYRGVVLSNGKRPKLIAASEPISVAPIDLKSVIRQFYYDRTQAYTQSSRAGANWDNAHNSSWFPISSAAWKKGNDYYIRHHDIETAVPDLTTIAPDPTWKLSKTPCSAAMTTPPPGRTFIVTVAFGGTMDGYGIATDKSDVHVTLSNGKLVDYEQSCR
jgi:hypothetical protein